MTRPSVMADFPIVLRSIQLAGIRAGKRTHICLPAYAARKFRTAFSEEGRKAAEREDAARGVLPLPSMWSKVGAGDRLWVQEEITLVRDNRNRADVREHFSVDLLGGHAPIPGRFKRGRWIVEKLEARGMTRPQSRYILTVTDVRHFRCRDIRVDEVKAETLTAFAVGVDSIETWWHVHYGFVLPWRDNSEVIGLTFTCSYANVDGLELPPLEKGENRLAKMLDEMFPVEKCDVCGAPADPRADACAKCG